VNAIFSAPKNWCLPSVYKFGALTEKGYAKEEGSTEGRKLRQGRGGCVRQARHSRNIGLLRDGGGFATQKTSCNQIAKLLIAANQKAIRAAFAQI